MTAFTPAMITMPSSTPLPKLPNMLPAILPFGS
eukprot:CAMPEP_0204036258 /NCGR_PEP_ID=MMETSP0360-20130528/79124_1 /ASSEMBLY_ACC=CAM_ASM_000342 /TAXON_ID=268821 /ORGANISM="Scrippsiella Hangoei, Strain SHTV-5" /LENGTH=32 /DNA_ID= /DNA_START= /DNA_END= /DNA_ORIENTATION=